MKKREVQQTVYGMLKDVLKPHGFVFSRIKKSGTQGFRRQIDEGVQTVFLAIGHYGPMSKISLNAKVKLKLVADILCQFEGSGDLDTVLIQQTYFNGKERIEIRDENIESTIEELRDLTSDTIVPFLETHKSLVDLEHLLNIEKPDGVRAVGDESEIYQSIIMAYLAPNPHYGQFVENMAEKRPYYRDKIKELSTFLESKSWQIR